MIHKNAALSVFLLLEISITGLHAQQSLTTGGGNATGSGGSASYTIGQMLNTTNNGASGSVIHGVQVPFEVFLVTGLKEANGINLFCSIYPNPVNNVLILKVENYDISKLSYQLYDFSGKILENKLLTGSETAISLENYPPATYLLKLTETDKEIKVFKTIKTQ